MPEYQRLPSELMLTLIITEPYSPCVYPSAAAVPLCRVYPAGAHPVTTSHPSALCGSDPGV